MLRLEELLFREDTREGGTVIEYLVEGRPRTQTVPRMVGDVLAAVVKDVLELKEKDRERFADTSRNIGERRILARSDGPGSRPVGKGKAKTHPQA